MGLEPWLIGLDIRQCCTSGSIFLPDAVDRSGARNGRLAASSQPRWMLHRQNVGRRHRCGARRRRCGTKQASRQSSRLDTRKTGERRRKMPLEFRTNRHTSSSRDGQSRARRNETAPGTEQGKGRHAKGGLVRKLSSMPRYDVVRPGWGNLR